MRFISGSRPGFHCLTNSVACFSLSQTQSQIVCSLACVQENGLSPNRQDTRDLRKAIPHSIQGSRQGRKNVLRFQGRIIPAVFLRHPPSNHEPPWAFKIHKQNLVDYNLRWCQHREQIWRWIEGGSVCVHSWAQCMLPRFFQKNSTHDIYFWNVPLE